ncbi:MAG: primosomal protein N', partial [Candidatus Sulfotelmatobacter sp.]
MCGIWTAEDSLSFHTMPEFCDVAVPVPLDMVFTYRVAEHAAPVVGARVLVPFRQRRMTGIVVELHDRKPSVAAKNILAVLDTTPVLDAQLLQLGRWIADYYLAPLGEVFRTMLPLNAEFKRGVAYRITAEGQMALHLAGMSGSSARSRRSPEEQAAEFRVLDYLAAQEPAPGETVQVREESLRSAMRVAKSILTRMVRKKWLAREDVSAVRDATRTVKIAVLKSADGKLNDNQRKLIESLAASGGQVPVETLQALEIPRTTLSTLVRRGLIEIIEEPATFAVSRSKPRPERLEFDFNPAQQS